MMHILINYYKTVHTTPISEMTDNATIFLTCVLWTLVVITSLSNLLQYTIQNKETKSKKQILYLKGSRDYNKK